MADEDDKLKKIVKKYKYLTIVLLFVYCLRQYQ